MLYSGLDNRHYLLSAGEGRFVKMELKGKTTIITGSGRGIGRAPALEFSREGTNVVCCARSEKEIRETVALLEKEGGHGIAIQTDVTRKNQVADNVLKTQS